MNKKDTITEKIELIMDALVYANEHKLDIGNKDSVRKILENIDPLHSTEEDAEEFMKLLQDAETVIEMTKKITLQKIQYLIK